MSHSHLINEISKYISANHDNDITSLWLSHVSDAIAEKNTSLENKTQLLSPKKELEDLRSPTIPLLPYGSSCTSGFDNIRRG